MQANYRSGLEATYLPIHRRGARDSLAQTTIRKKASAVYRYLVYRCAFAKTKGPAVCAHGTAYRQERAAFQGHNARTTDLAGTIGRLEGQASHLVRFLAIGGDSPTVRAELRAIDTMLEGLRVEHATIDKLATFPQRRMHPRWVSNKLQRLDELMRRDPQRAKTGWI